MPPNSRERFVAWLPRADTPWQRNLHYLRQDLHLACIPVFPGSAVSVLAGIRARSWRGIFIQRPWPPNDQGQVAPSLAISYITLTLAPSASQQAGLSRFNRARAALVEAAGQPAE